MRQAVLEWVFIVFACFTMFLYVMVIAEKIWNFIKDFIKDLF